MFVCLFLLMFCFVFIPGLKKTTIQTQASYHWRQSQLKEVVIQFGCPHFWEEGHRHNCNVKLTTKKNKTELIGKRGGGKSNCAHADNANRRAPRIISPASLIREENGCKLLVLMVTDMVC